MERRERPKIDTVRELLREEDEKARPEPPPEPPEEDPNEEQHEAPDDS